MLSDEYYITTVLLRYYLNSLVIGLFDYIECDNEGFMDMTKCKNYVQIPWLIVYIC